MRSNPLSVFLGAVWLFLWILPGSATQGAAASVEGRVVKAADGEGIADVSVELVRANANPPQAGANPLPVPPSSRLGATTDAAGRFVISNVPPGEYRLYATHPNGYVPAEYGQRSVTGIGQPITLTAGQKLSDAILRMSRTASISGRVIDADGDPAVFASILAFRISYRQGGERKVEIVQSVLTDDHGDFRIFWLTPGKYYLSAMPIEPRRYGLPLSYASRFGGAQYLASPMLGYRTLESGEIVEETWVPIYYPGTTDIRSARQITLEAGQNFNVGLSIADSPRRTLQVGGVVFDPNGQPLPGAAVDLTPRKSDGHSVVLPRAQTGDDGRFTIHGVLPGNYLMFVSGDGTRDAIPGARALSANTGQAPKLLTAALSVDVSTTGVQELKIQTVPALDIPWQATIEGSTASVPLNLRVSVTRDPNVAGAQNSAMPVNQPGGNILRNVGFGDYRVNIANLPQNAYVRSIRMGSQDVLKDGLHVSAEARDPLEIIIGARGAAVDGVVVSCVDRRISSATVVLLPDLSQRETRLDLFKTATSSVDGKFHFDGITPGTYRLFAWEDFRPGDWYDAELMKTYEFNGVEVRLNESDARSVNVTVIPVERTQ